MRTRTWGTASLAAISGLLLVTAAQAQFEQPANNNPGLMPVQPLALRAAAEQSGAWWQPTDSAGRRETDGDSKEPCGTASAQDPIAAALTSTPAHTPSAYEHVVWPLVV